MTFARKLMAAFALAAFGIAARLVPHLPNATPITAVTLMGSRYLGRTWSLAIPLIAMLSSDLLIGFYDWKILATVYLSFALIAALGWITGTRGFGALLGTALAASGIFFLITNAAVWAFSPLYVKTLAGLLEAYVMGLPFLGNMIVSDLLYTASLYGICESLKYAALKKPALLGGLSPVR